MSKGSYFGARQAFYRAQTPHFTTWPVCHAGSAVRDGAVVVVAHLSRGSRLSNRVGA